MTSLKLKRGRWDGMKLEKTRGSAATGMGVFARHCGIQHVRSAGWLRPQFRHMPMSQSRDRASPEPRYYYREEPWRLKTQPNPILSTDSCFSSAAYAEH
jgi:hypothetical protein